MPKRSADSSVEEADVVVVGAGPVGLTAALLLGTAGVRTVILERAGGPSSSPKAISLDDTSMRTYQRAGLDAAISSIIVPGTGTAYYDRHGEMLFHARGPDGAPQGHPFKNPFAQPELEALLHRHVRLDPHLKLLLKSQLVGLDQDADHVQLSYDGPRGRRRTCAKYAIAADGGQSTVRKLLDITMTGRSFDEAWLVVDTLGDTHDERFGMHHGDPERPLVIVPGLRGRCRYEFKLRPEETRPGAPPPFDLIHQLLAPYRRITPDQVERAVVYGFHALVAQRFQDGRVFLAGDAAHMMPPFSGQGLNSGIRDVANLTWKVADVCRERLPAAALASYEQERRPHVEATVEQSVLLGDNMMTTSQHVATTRDRQVRAALESPYWRAFLERMEYRPSPDIDYGLVVDADASGTAGTTVAQPFCFSMSLHRVCRLDEAIGPGWSLLGVDVPDATLNQLPALGHPLSALPVAVVTTDRNPRAGEATQVVVDFDGGLSRAFAAHSGQCLLVRPDRVVAARWPATAMSEGRDAIASLVAGHNRATSSPTEPDRCPIWVDHVDGAPSHQHQEQPAI